MTIDLGGCGGFSFIQGSYQVIWSSTNSKASILPLGIFFMDPTIKTKYSNRPYTVILIKTQVMTGLFLSCSMATTNRFLHPNSTYQPITCDLLRPVTRCPTSCRSPDCEWAAASLGSKASVEAPAKSLTNDDIGIIHGSPWKTIQRKCFLC